MRAIGLVPNTTSCPSPLGQGILEFPLCRAAGVRLTNNGWIYNGRTCWSPHGLRHIAVDKTHQMIGLARHNRVDPLGRLELSGQPHSNIPLLGHPLARGHKSALASDWKILRNWYQYRGTAAVVTGFQHSHQACGSSLTRESRHSVGAAQAMLGKLCQERSEVVRCCGDVLRDCPHSRNAHTARTADFGSGGQPRWKEFDSRCFKLSEYRIDHFRRRRFEMRVVRDYGWSARR